jgi:hypothetical protein
MNAEQHPIANPFIAYSLMAFLCPASHRHPLWSPHTSPRSISTHHGPIFHPTLLPSSDCSSTLKIQKQFNSNAQIASFVPRKGNSKNQLRSKY